MLEAKVVHVILEVLGGGLQAQNLYPTLVEFVDFIDLVEGELDQRVRFLPVLSGDLQLLCQVFNVSPAKIILVFNVDSGTVDGVRTKLLGVHGFSSSVLVTVDGVLHGEFDSGPQQLLVVDGVILHSGEELVVHEVSEGREVAELGLV